MAFSFSSTGGSSGVTSITVSATSRQELTDIVENFTLANQTKSLGLQVGQRAYEPLEKYIIFQPTGMTWAASGDTGSLNIQSNDDWTIVSNGWIQLSRYEEANRGQVERPNTLSGNGNTIIGLRCSENTGETRTGGITGYCKSNSAISATTVIEQAGSYVKPYLTLSSTGCSIGSSSASTSVTVTSNISWNVISDVRWITINTLSGTGNGTISFEASENVDSIPRKGVITVFNATYDIYAEFVVEQAGEKQYIVISPYSFQVPSTGSSGNVISISANCDYDITTDVNWITLSAASGSGNCSVSFTTGENTSKYGETGNIIFSNSAVSSYATVEIMSVENYLSANTSSLTASIDGDTLSVNVYSNVAWAVSVDSGEDHSRWLSVVPTSGSNNGELRITVASGTTTRSGSILLYNSKYGLNWAIDIHQVDGKRIYYTTLNNLVYSGLTTNTFGDATLVSNTYSGYTGVLLFDRDVKEIPDNAFYSNVGQNTLTTIQLPTTVTRIGANSFRGLSMLSVCEIPDAVTYIGERAFKGCNSLSSVTISENVATIGEEAFAMDSGSRNVYYNATSATVYTSTPATTPAPFLYNYGNLVLGNKVQSIPNYLFNTAHFTGTLSLPTSLTSIGQQAFESNDFTGDLTIRSGVTLGSSAFRFNSSFDGTLTIENGATFYSSSFAYDTNWEHINWKNTPGDALISNGHLFLGCKNTVIPNTVQTLGESAFQGCTGLTYITIPASVRTVSGSCFQDCTSLIRATFEGDGSYSGNYYLQAGAFRGCRQLIQIWAYFDTFPPVNGNSVFYNVSSSGVLLHKNNASYVSRWKQNLPSGWTDAGGL